MLVLRQSLAILALLTFSACFSLKAEEKPLPEKMLKIMHQKKYVHSFWGVYVKDTTTGQLLYDLNSHQMFLPASTTKLFSMSALLNAYGDDYRFKTPVYAVGTIQEGRLAGNLVIVAQGDLTMGGRQKEGSDQIAFTNMDHTIANEVPGVTLTPEDPLRAFNEFAKQIHDKGITEIDGDILIDARLFEATEKRGMIISPMMINENLIDLVINPGEVGQEATIVWRPQVPGYTLTNQVKTVSKGEKTDFEMTTEDQGRKLLIKGTISQDQKDLVRTFSIKDPNQFAKTAMIQALTNQGITVKGPQNSAELPSESSLKEMKPIALWTSPPLTEYVKLTLKVSHNVGANLAPLLLAAKNGKKTFNEGMLLFGDFVKIEVKVPVDAFVFIDGAGGDENRLTPMAEVRMLEYIRKQPGEHFRKFYDALPILGVDGSLADFAKNTDAVGKVRAKPGTGVSFNLAANKFFLTTQALAGYVEGKDGHLIEFMIAVNNGQTPKVDDIFAIFEDFSQMAAIIYDLSENQRE